jgi:hypothetical protein
MPSQDFNTTFVFKKVFGQKDSRLGWLSLGRHEEEFFSINLWTSKSSRSTKSIGLRSRGGAALERPCASLQANVLVAVKAGSPNRPLSASSGPKLGF